MFSEWLTYYFINCSWTSKQKLESRKLGGDFKEFKMLYLINLVFPTLKIGFFFQGRLRTSNFLVYDATDGWLKNAVVMLES